MTHELNRLMYNLYFKRDMVIICCQFHLTQIVILSSDDLYQSNKAGQFDDHGFYLPLQMIQMQHLVCHSK